MILIYSLHLLNTPLSAKHFTSYRVQSVDSPYKVGLKRGSKVPKITKHTAKPAFEGREPTSRAKLVIYITVLIMI